MGTLLAKGIAVFFAGLLGGQVLYGFAKAPSFLLRPPGAQGEEDFLARCIGCGKCIEACPYVAVRSAPFAVGPAAGTPVIDAREQACRLCEGFPCVGACPTGALRDVGVRTDVRMGTAVIDEELCIAIDGGIRCEVCYRSCPLINRAIDIELRPRAGDSTHVLFAPVIDEEQCVGCGLCVERCVVGDPAPAIRIGPPQNAPPPAPQSAPESAPQSVPEGAPQHASEKKGT
ncbi:MAG: 4Fe-4S dicluster domain-containing protein [Coriobacteriales bacterium]|jgi:ferredoxin-type protein NapG|nr:4Fe-4S dicluster domain-containing protein [Coriobacteriales bacterium]